MVPAILWVSFAFVVYLSLREPLKEAIPRMTRIGALGVVEVEFTEVERLLTKAVESSDQEETGPLISRADRRAVIRRLDHAAVYLKGGRILWVDDLPEGNSYLTALFRQLGMVVDEVTSTDRALGRLDQHTYDLVISDLHRGADSQAGIEMLRAFRSRGISLPVIIHAARFDPTLGVDPMIFGGTNRVDDVVHYVIDVMERVRLGDG
ncbi:response regulator [Microbispora cellulosiformans]|uniref:Response regulator n=2 Tax=Microbispora cellulosiformans TaxID=2614688 RepID=A0A5J5K4W4_9ACTN|nr:response regulator [Microbispora cellulosiformans]